MSRRIYKKPHRAKTKKPVFAKAGFWQFLLAVSVLGGGAWFICFSPALEVKEIKITGAQRLDGRECMSLIDRQVNKKIALFDSKSILLFDLDRTKKEIMAKFPQLQDIKIERQFPSKIVASLEERREAAVFIDENGKNYLVDNDGIVFEEGSGQSGLLEIRDNRQKKVELGKNILPKDFLSGLLRIKGEMDSRGAGVKAAVIATPERVNVETKDGWYVYFNPLKDVEAQLSKLAAVMVDESFQLRKGNLEYLDVRFTRVYLKEKQALPQESAVSE